MMAELYRIQGASREGSNMKILMINPNSSQEMSKTIDEAAKKYASPGTEITTVTMPDGPEFIGTAGDFVEQLPKVVETVRRNLAAYDHFVIACGANVGLEPSREVTRNVLGIGEVAFATACAVARSFSVLTPVTEGEQFVPGALDSLGIDRGKCASVRVVGDGAGDAIVRNRHQQLDAYLELGRRCVQDDGAGALVLNCAGMSDLKEILERQLGVPVTSGVGSSVKLAEQFGAVADR
jgi:allantoin racemase